jgi:hypothetical protein
MTGLLSIALVAVLSNPFANTNPTITPNNEEPTAVVAAIQNAFAYPAKASEIVALSYVLNTNDSVTIVITDSKGNTVATLDEAASIGKHTLIYDVVALKKGNYTCQITTKNTAKTIHFARK